MIKLAKNRLASYLRTVLLTHLQKNHQSIALEQCDTTERLVAHVKDESVLLSQWWLPLNGNVTYK